GTIASYSWNFGDGSAAGTGATPTHTYATANTYTVTLTVTDNGGATATSTASATGTAAQAPMNQPPVARVGGPYAASINSAINFDGSTSSDADGTIAGYSWDFGDNSAAGTGAKPSHTYATAGTYTVKLTVTDDKGATATSQTTVAVAGPTQPFTWSTSF